jgi:hypothetical protein
MTFARLNKAKEIKDIRIVRCKEEAGRYAQSVQERYRVKKIKQRDHSGFNIRKDRIKILPTIGELTLAIHHIRGWEITVRS